MTHIMKINLAKIIWCLIIRHHNHTINNKNKKKVGKIYKKYQNFYIIAHSILKPMIKLMKTDLKKML